MTGGARGADLPDGLPDCLAGGAVGHFGWFGQAARFLAGKDVKS